MGEEHEMKDMQLLDEHVLLEKNELVQIPGYVPNVEDVILAPNCENIETVVSVANGGRKPSVKKPLLSGKLFPVGTFGVCVNNLSGHYELVGAGEWTALWSYRVSFVVGKPVVLSQCSYRGSNGVFSHETITVMQIPRDSYGIGEKNGATEILGPGLHVRNDAQFKWIKFKKVVDNYISHLDTHIIQVGKGRLALVKCNNRPYMLSEGTHCFKLALFEYVKQVDETDPLIVHGTITRFQVNLGNMALAYFKNEPVLIEKPGIYIRNSSDFIFDRFERTDASLVELGSIKVITVSPGLVGVVYKPDLQILGSGCHTFNDPRLTFEGFIDTKERCIQLRQHFAQGNGRQNAADINDVVVCDTREFVPVGIMADLYYRIADPEKVVLTIGTDIHAIDLRMNELGKAQLNAITRNTSLAEIAQSGAGLAEEFEDVADPNAPKLFEKVHDEFISVLHDTCKDLYGIELVNLRIESFKIRNQELAEQISSHAIITAETESQLANLRGKAEIASAEQTRIAEVQRIESEAYGTALKIKSDADNALIIDLARSRAQADIIKSEAEAKSMVTLRNADAQALLSYKTAEAEGIRLLADAEADRAAKLQSTGLGRDLALAEIYSKTVSESMSGVEKMVYLPSEKGLFSFLDMQTVSSAVGQLAGTNKTI